MNRIKMLWIIGLMLLYQLFFVQLLSGFAWLLGASVSALIFPVSTVLACGLGIYYLKAKYKVLLIVLGIWVLSVAAAIIFPDFSTDGQYYHQAIVYALANGWNPIWSHHNSIIDSGWCINIWIDHYCKGTELLSASIVAIIGNIEAGKAINFVLPTTSVFLVVYCMYELFAEKLSHSRLSLYSILICFPTIIASQVFTYYIDWAVYYVIILLLASCILLFKNKYKDALLLLIPVLYITVGLKYNAVFWAAYFLLVIGMALFYKSKQKSELLKASAIMGAVVLCAVLITNINPYLTNLSDHHNLTYPITTSEEDVAFLNKGAQPDFMANWGRPAKVGYSLMSLPYNKHTMPHNILQTNYEAISNPAPIIGGWGVLFPLALVLSILLFLISVNRKSKVIYLLLFIIFLLTLIILPYGSCYRYVPFTSLLPIILLLYVEKSENRRWVKFSSTLICSLLLSNSVITICSTAALSLCNKIATNYYVSRIMKCEDEKCFVTESWSFNYKFHGNNVVSKDTQLKDKGEGSIWSTRNKVLGDEYIQAHLQPCKVYVDTTKVDIKNEKTKIESIIVRDENY